MSRCGFFSIRRKFNRKHANALKFFLLNGDGIHHLILAAGETGFEKIGERYGIPFNSSVYGVTPVASANGIGVWDGDNQKWQRLDKFLDGLAAK